MVYLWRMCVIYMVYVECITISQQNENETDNHTKNFDEIQNDVLFNFHLIREKENMKKKRNAIQETKKISKHENIRRAFVLPISGFEWDKNNIRTNAKRNTEAQQKPPGAERIKPSKRSADQVSKQLIAQKNIEVPRNNLTICDMEQLMTYLAQLQAINPESIINLASQQDVDALCDRAVNSLDNIDTYLRTCTPPTQKDLYLQLIKGVRSLSEKVCFDRNFRTEFMKHASCFTQLHNEYKDCVGPYDWVEDPNKTVICRTYSDINHCYYVKTTTACGEESAKIMKMLLKFVMDSVVSVDCGDEIFSTTCKSSPVVLSSPTQLPWPKNDFSDTTMKFKKRAESNTISTSAPKKVGNTRETMRRERLSVAAKSKLFKAYLLLVIILYVLF